MTTEIIPFETLRDLFDPTTAEQARSLVRENPAGALIQLSQVRTSGTLTLARQSVLLEEIVGQIVDPDDASDLISDHLDPVAAAELIAIRGDLPSVTSTVVDVEVIIAAIVGEVANAPNVVSAALRLKAWADKLRERDDWHDLLNRTFGDDGFTLGDYLIVAVYRDNVEPEERLHADDDSDDTDEDYDSGFDIDYNAGYPRVSPDVWVDVGLHPDSSEERLSEMLSSGNLPEFDEADVVAADDMLRAQRLAYEQASTTVEATTPVEAATAVADDVEI